MPRTKALTVAQRLAVLEKEFTTLADAFTELVEAHNALDARHEYLYYKLQYVMDFVRVQRVKPGALLDVNEKPIAVQGSLTEFFTIEGAAYINVLKAQADAIQKKLDGEAAILQAARDTIADGRGVTDGRTATNGTSAAEAAGNGTGQAPSGPRLVHSQA